MIRHILTLLLFLMVLPTEPISASGPDRPREVSVGLYVLHIGAPDLMKGTFTADFYLTLKDSEPIQDDSFEFMNGLVRKLELLEDYQEENGMNVKIYRVIGDFSSRMDLRRYPFDVQNLSIKLESKVESTEKMVYVTKPSDNAMDEHYHFPGWILQNTSTEIREHDYPVFNEKYTQFVFSAAIGKKSFQSFFQAFGPLAFMILVCLLSFLMGADKLHIRSKMTNVSLVVAGIFYKKLTDRIPAVASITFIDKYMSVTYLLLVVFVLVNVYVMHLQNQKREETIAVIQQHSFYLLSLFTLIAYAGLFGLGL